MLFTYQVMINFVYFFLILCYFFNMKKLNINDNNVINLLNDESYWLCMVILANISEAVFITDHNGVFKFICPNVKYIFKTSTSVILSYKNIKNIIGKSNFFKIHKLFETLNPGEEIKNIECEINDFFHNKILTLINIKNIEINANNYLLYTIRDNTDMKKIQNKIIEKNEIIKQNKDEFLKKNHALQEILKNIEEEKNSIKEEITLNIEKIVLPAMKKFRLKQSDNDLKQLDEIIENLEKISTPFYSKLYKMHIKLTNRELELCNYLKNGLTSKEIGIILNLSPTTIERHRNNIRKKLKLTSNSINLSAYLQNIYFDD